jgi:hypothetical protein
MALTNEQLQERANILADIEETTARIARQNEAIATLSGQEKQDLQDIIEQERIRLRLRQQEVEPLNEQVAAEEAAARAAAIRSREARKIQTSFAKLTPDVRALILDSNNGANSYTSATARIVELKSQEADLEGDALELNLQKQATFREMQSSLASQAKETDKARKTAKGINDDTQKRLEYESSISDFLPDEREELLAMFDQQVLMRKEQERINMIMDEQKGLFDSLPAPIQQSVGFAKKLGTAMKAGLGPLVIIGAIVAATFKSFSDLDEAAEDFRKETGITNSQMGEMKSQANDIVGTYGKFGVEAKNVFDTLSALKAEMGDVATYSEAAVGAITVLGTNYGISADNAAKVQGVMENVGGLSQDTAASVQLQVANMAKLAGVAPAKVFADIAENAEVASTFFKGDINALAKAAVNARRLGTSIKEAAEVSEKLLDFEAGIEDELVAATFVGGQFNLSRARALAMEGKLVEAQSETLSQIQRSGDFRKKDYFTQKQLAKAAGMTVEQINKQLNTQDKLSKLSVDERKRAEEAIASGLDITNINEDQLNQEVAKHAAQQEQAGQLKQMQNAFMGIAATIGSVLTPLLEALIPIMNLILFPVQLIAEGFKFLGDNLALAIPLAAGLAIAFAPAIIAAITSAVGFIMSSFAMIPLGVGIPLGIAAVAGLFSMISKAKSVGDVMSPADGKTQISTKEGGLLELSPNDDLIAAPGAAKALASGNGATNMTPQMNLSVLSTPLNAMINEIKALRADMASGKIAVHMDGAKVTAGVSNQINKNTRNNFAIG